MTVLTKTLFAALAALAALATTTATSHAANCYVATTGNDTNPGTISQPFLTIQHAVDVLVPPTAAHQCDQIRVRTGTYVERVKILDRSDLEIYAYDGARTAIIDASAAPVDATLPVQIAIGIYDSHDIIIRDLEIKNDATVFCTAIPPSTSMCNVGGIDVRNWVVWPSVGEGASSHHVRIHNNLFRDVRAATITDKDGVRPFNGSVIAVYSDRNGLTPLGLPDSSEATQRVEITENVIEDCDINGDIFASAAIVVAGNVEDVLIAGNLLSDLTPTAPAQPYTGAIQVSSVPLPSPSTAILQASEVVIRHNEVASVPGVGIFIEKGTDVLIERNRLVDLLYGVQIVSETAAGHSSSAHRSARVWARNNYIVAPHVFGIDVGMIGFAYSPVEDVYLTNNTIELLPPNLVPGQYAILMRNGIDGQSKLLNNLVQMAWSMSVGGAFLLRHDTSTCFPMAAVLNSNLWWVAGYPSNLHPSLFKWFRIFDWPPPCSSIDPAPIEQSFAAHQTFGDAAGLFTDPLLSSGFIGASSPAIDAGDTSGRTPPWAAFGYYDSGVELDFYGNTRVTGGVIDIGMEER